MKAVPSKSDAHTMYEGTTVIGLPRNMVTRFRFTDSVQRDGTQAQRWEAWGARLGRLMQDGNAVRKTLLIFPVPVQTWHSQVCSPRFWYCISEVGGCAKVCFAAAAHSWHLGAAATCALVFNRAVACQKPLKL